MSDERRVVQEAVLMLDLVGSSVVAAKFGDAKAAEVKAALDSLVRRAVAACNGAFIKDTGDGHFVTFEHELDATRCAIATLSALETHNRETGPRQSKWRPEFELHVRVGITFGELHVDRHGDRQGNTANLSARFEALKPEALICLEGGMAKEEFEELAQDRVLVDWCVRDGIMDEFGAFVTFVGAFKPKGVGTLEEVYLLDWRDAPHVDLPPRDDEPPRNLPQAGPARALRPNLPPPERFELRGIDWYCEEDRHYLHGRAEDVAQVRGLLANCAVVRLTGPSGVGKSSLLRAALAPALREIGWRVAVIRPMRHPAVQLLRELSVELLTEGSPTFAEPLEPGLLRAEIAPLLAAENRACLVLLIDQVEDILAPDAGREAWEALSGLLGYLHRTRFEQPLLKAVVAYRNDADARLGPLWQEVSGAPTGLPYHTLAGLTRDDAARMLDEVKDRRGWDFGTSARDLAAWLAGESAGLESAGEVFPPYLQILLAEAEAHGGEVPREVLTQPGQLIANYLNERLDRLKARGGDWVLCRRLVEELSRSSGEKQARTAAELASACGMAPEVVEELLRELVHQRLVRPVAGGAYEVQHDKLALAVVEAMAAGDREAKSLHEMLANRTANYERFHTLLTADEMTELYRYRHGIKPTEAEQRFLFVCLLGVVGAPGWFWLRSCEAAVIGHWLRDLARGDKHRSVRRAAAAAIGKMGQTEDLPLLRELARDKDEEVQRASAASIAGLGRPDALPLLRECARDRDWRVRQAAASAIGATSQPEDLPLLRDLARDKHWSVRHWAVSALERIDRPEALALLVGLAREEHAEGRVAAVSAIGRMRRPEDLPLLRELARDTAWWVRQAAVSALGILGQPEDLLLLRDLSRDKDDTVLNTVVSAIGVLGQSEALPLLRDLARDKRSSVRQAAAQAIGNMGQPEDLPLLSDLAGDENAFVRGAAVSAIAGMDQPLALMLLSAFARDKASSVREAAASAIDRLSQPENRPLLRALANHGRWPVRRAAAAAIGRVGRPEDLPLLRDVADDQIARVRLAAAAAIGGIGSPEGLPLLVTLARDVDKDVREAAVSAIGRLGQPEDLPLLRDIVRDKTKSVRQAAVQAILVGLQLPAADIEKWLDEESAILPADVLAPLDRHLYAQAWLKAFLESRDRGAFGW